MSAIQMTKSDDWLNTYRMTLASWVSQKTSFNHCAKLIIKPLPYTKVKLVSTTNASPIERPWIEVFSDEQMTQSLGKQYFNGSIPTADIIIPQGKKWVLCSALNAASSTNITYDILSFSN